MARKGGALARALLRVRVHWDAWRRDPAAYLEATGWRIRGLKLRSKHRFSSLMGHSPHAYRLWTMTREVGAFGHEVNAPASEPLIHIVVDCRGGSHGLRQSLASIEHAMRPACRVVVLGDQQPPEPGVTHIADTCALASLLKESSAGDRPLVLAMAAGDLLAPQALDTYRAALATRPEAALLYGDDDLISSEGRRHTPHFKPDWNSELFRHLDYLSNSCLFVCDPDRIDEGWPVSALPLVPAPVHLDRVLHHRMRRPRAVRPSPTAAPAPPPQVSVIVPTRDHLALLQTCIEGLAATRYPALDITVIDNGSARADTLDYLRQLQSGGVRVIGDPGPFNYAAMHNAVVPSAAGPLLCFLNNDIEVIDPEWLSIMVTSAMREDVGAVGARLLYPDGTIQHAGVVTGVGGGAGHAHRLQRDDEEGYFGRAHLPQFVSAVTAACMVVRKDRFLAVGGFDAQNFAVAFNDVDLCLKLNQRGWQSFYEARACLIHHESKSRGLDRDGAKKARFEGELAALKRIWRTDRQHDPFHHRELSPFGEQFVVRL